MKNTQKIGMLAPLEEVDGILATLAKRFHRDARLREALEIATQTLEERRLEEAGDLDGWRMDQVRDEIDRLTDTSIDPGEGPGKD